MHQGTAGCTRSVIDRRNNKAVRETAKLRARRAACLAAESIAGRCHMVVAGACVLVIVVSGIVIATTPIVWVWITTPAATLVASLATSRTAAVCSQRASECELELLTKLRGDAHGAGCPTVAAPTNTQASSSISEEVSEVVEATEPQTGSVPSLVFNVEVSEVVEVADIPARAWTVVSIPASTCTSCECVRRHVVHVGIDLRGIPRIVAAIPARPIAQTAQVGVHSTAEIVADQAVALDLDVVLGVRRAQQGTSQLLIPRRRPSGSRCGRLSELVGG